MQSPRLEALINEVLANKQQPPVTTLTASSRLREDLGFASLDLAELTVRIEERFGVDVFADGLVHTVGEIEAKIAEAKR
jgi:acyl carrier protein